MGSQIPSAYTTKLLMKRSLMLMFDVQVEYLYKVPSMKLDAFALYLKLNPKFNERANEPLRIIIEQMIMTFGRSLSASGLQTARARSRLIANNNQGVA